MKTVKLFPILFLGFATSLMMISWTPKSLKVIVDEVIFVNGNAAAGEQAQAVFAPIYPMEVLNNLPNSHTKKDISNGVNWYDNNRKSEGYFVRVESLDAPGTAKLEFKMMLKFENGRGKVLLFLPPAKALEPSSLKQNAEKKAKLDVLLESKSGIKCELICNGDGFKISNISMATTKSQFRVVIFSKKNID